MNLEVETVPASIFTSRGTGDSGTELLIGSSLVRHLDIPHETVAQASISLRRPSKDLPDGTVADVYM